MTVSKDPVFRVDDLDALAGFRSALGLRAGKERRDAGKVHCLALKLGVWGGGYAPPRRSGRSTAVRRRVLQGYAPGGGRMMPSIPEWSVSELGRPRRDVRRGGGLGWIWAKNGRLDKFMPGKKPHAEPAYLAALMPVAARRWTVAPGRRRQFAPLPPAEFSSGRARMEAVQPWRVQRGREDVVANGQGRGAMDRHFAGDALGGETVAPMASQKRQSQGERGEAPGLAAQHLEGPAFSDALDDYFFRQSRLAPTGGTGFDPRLSPLWAGLKLPV